MSYIIRVFTAIIIFTALHENLSSQIGGSGWYFTNPLPHGNSILAVDAGGSDLIQVGERGTIALSTNNGQTFSLQLPPTEKDIRDVKIISSQEYFAVGADGGFRTTNRGLTWLQTLAGTPELFAVSYSQNVMYVGGNLGYIGKSTNNGISFSTVHNTPVTDILDFQAFSANEVFAVGTFGKILYTSNGGTNWVERNSNVFTPITSVDFFNRQFGAASTLQGNVITTSDGGNTWTPRFTLVNHKINDIKMKGISDIFGIGDSDVVRSTNGGLNWFRTYVPTLRAHNVMQLGNDSGLAYVFGKFNESFATTNSGALWQRYGMTSIAETMRDMQKIANYQSFQNSAQYDTMYVAGDSGTVLKTTDMGQSFQVINTPTTMPLFSGVFFNGSTGFIGGGKIAGVVTGIILYTTNGGASWVTQNPIDDVTKDFYFFNSSTGVLCGHGGKIARTTNGGQNWSILPSGTSVALHSVDFADQNTGIICGAFGTTRRTTDAGQTWTTISGNSFTLLGVSFADANTGIMVGSSGRIYRTTNAGLNWVIIPSITGNALYSVQMMGDIGFACGPNLGNDASIIKTTNRGQSWFRTNSGTNNELYSVFFINQTTGFSVGEGTTILKTTNAGISIAVEVISQNVPIDFTLEQNYPNPFNPQTNIRFSLPKSTYIKLEVYDITGRLIEVLADGSYHAGVYESKWNAGGLSSGVYFYKLESEGFTQTKKMILVK